MLHTLFPKYETNNHTEADSADSEALLKTHSKIIF